MSVVYVQCVKCHAQRATHECRCRFNLGGNYGPPTFPKLYYQQMDCAKAEAESSVTVAGNTTTSTNTTAGKWTFDTTSQQYHYNLQVRCTVQQLAGLQTCVHNKHDRRVPGPFASQPAHLALHVHSITLSHSVTLLFCRRFLTSGPQPTRAISSGWRTSCAPQNTSSSKSGSLK